MAYQSHAINTRKHTHSYETRTQHTLETIEHIHTHMNKTCTHTHKEEQAPENSLLLENPRKSAVNRSENICMRACIKKSMCNDPKTYAYVHKRMYIQTHIRMYALDRYEDAVQCNVCTSVCVYVCGSCMQARM